MKHTASTNGLGGYAKRIGWVLVPSVVLAFFAAGAMPFGGLRGGDTVEAVAEPMPVAPLSKDAESVSSEDRGSLPGSSIDAAKASPDGASAAVEEPAREHTLKSPLHGRSRGSLKRTKRVEMPPPPSAPINFNAPPSMFLSQNGISAPRASTAGDQLATMESAPGLAGLSAREYAEQAKKGALVDPSKMPPEVAKMVDLGGVPIYQPEKKVGVAIRPMFPAGVTIGGKFH